MSWRVAALVGATLAASCGGGGGASYLLVELVPASDTVKVALVTIKRDGDKLSLLCVRVGGATAAQPASVLLERSAPAPASTPVTVSVEAYEAVAGFDTVSAGDEFPCPGTFPTALGAPQAVTTALCDGEARRLGFVVGATCAGCGANEVCGAGLASTGADCGPTSCCADTIADACALDLAP